MKVELVFSDSLFSTICGSLLLKVFDFGVVERSLPVVDFTPDFGSEGTPLLYVPTMESLLTIPN